MRQKTFLEGPGPVKRGRRCLQDAFRGWGPISSYPTVSAVSAGSAERGFPRRRKLSPLRSTVGTQTEIGWHLSMRRLLGWFR